MEITRFCVTNPMPDYVKDNVDLMNRFHTIGNIDPLKGVADFINYFFQTLTVWIVCVTEIFKSSFYAISESISECMQEKGDPMAELSGWSKAAAYHLWESAVLPFVFLLGYFSEDVRKPFLTDVECSSTDNVRKKMRLLEVEKEALSTQLEEVKKERNGYKERLDALDIALQSATGDVGRDHATLQVKTLLMYAQQQAHGEGRLEAEAEFKAKIERLEGDVNAQAQVIQVLEADVAKKEAELKERTSELEKVGLAGMRQVIMSVARQFNGNREKDVVLTSAFLKSKLAAVEG